MWYRRFYFSPKTTETKERIFFTNNFWLQSDRPHTHVNTSFHISAFCERRWRTREQLNSGIRILGGEWCDRRIVLFVYLLCLITVSCLVLSLLLWCLWIVLYFFRSVTFSYAFVSLLLFHHSFLPAFIFDFFPSSLPVYLSLCVSHSFPTKFILLDIIHNFFFLSDWRRTCVFGGCSVGDSLVE